MPHIAPLNKCNPNLHSGISSVSEKIASGRKVHWATTFLQAQGKKIN